MIVNQLDAEFFWRDPYKNEVDIAAASKVEVTADEVIVAGTNTNRFGNHS